MSEVPKAYRDEIDRLTDLYGFKPIPIRVNNRLRRAIARTLAYPGTPRGTARMDVNKAIGYMPDAAIIETARHEFAHVMEWVYDGKLSHSAKWQRYARQVGAVPKASAKENERIAATERTGA